MEQESPKSPSRTRPHDARSRVHVSVASDAGVRFTPFREFGRTVECTIQVPR
jgi:hypothetical protein